MRKKNREITDPNQILDIINKCEVMRVALCDDGEPYIVPLNFAYLLEGGKYVFYFHGAPEGRKIDMARKNPRVCFEVDCSLNIIKTEIPCQWTAEYESVIGYGQMIIIESEEEKKFALDLLMQRYGYKGELVYIEKALAGTAAFKIETESLTAKGNLAKK
jgi:nitroimidazol reductase NimA-like FMN-containing flavoprotein (pyridoxamine 5'-phosphate oxidase superfamily)